MALVVVGDDDVGEDGWGGFCCVCFVFGWERVSPLWFFGRAQLKQTPGKILIITKVFAKE